MYLDRFPASALACAGAFVVACMPGLAGADPSSGAHPLVNLIALAAANTTDPFNDIVGTFEHQRPGVLVTPEYAGTQILETQAEQGAPFDIFISADKTHVDALSREGLVDDVRLLSQGHEVIVVPKDNPADIESLRDLATRNAKIVLGTDAVPIGIYTRQILAKAAAAYGADFPSRVLGHTVSLETNVKQVLEKVALGEADAGIVYYTDVAPQFRDHVRIVPIPSAFEVEAANYICVARSSREPELARELEDLATGPTGRMIFRRHGYDRLP